MKSLPSASKTTQIGAYAAPKRLFKLTNRTRHGRFLKDIELQLLAQLAEPSFAQRLLVRRIARSMLQLEILDEKLCKADTWNDHDARTYGGLSNSVRLMLQTLGLKAQPAPAPSIDEIVARIGAEASSA